ncbi:MAG: hypothetical protein PVI99_02480, partial [Anaerolineales bacterium]|jgi:hypothetical protein
MNKFSIEDLKSLLEQHASPCVSIYLPMARSSDETKKNPIRYKNAIQNVEKQMEERGFEVRKIRSVRAQLEEAVDGFEFFQDQLGGLAVFLADDFIRIIKMPVRFEEQVEVGETFEIRPLLQALQNNMEFYILALSQENARLFRASEFDIVEIQLDEDVPTNFEEAMKYDVPQDQLQHQVLSGADGGNTAVYHGHTESDQTKKHLRRYFRMLDRGVGEAIVDHGLPVLLFGLDYLHSIYRDASELPEIIPEGIQKNPDELEIEQIHKLAWQGVTQNMESPQSQAISEFLNLMGDERSNTDMETIPLAAANGQVDKLLVDKNHQLWGIVDFDQQEVAIKKQSQQYEDTELVDFSIKHTLMNGGEVFVLDAQDIPVEDTPAAAVLRY